MDDDLYNLAVQAGMMPSGEYPEQTYSPPALSAPEQSLADQYPHESDGIPAPSAAPVTAINPSVPVVAQGGPTSVSKSRGSSQSSSGFGAAKFNEVGSVADRQLANGFAAADAKAKAEGAPDMARMEAAHNTQTLATHAVAQATANKIVEEGHQAALMADMQRGFSDEEAKANMMAEQSSKQGMANYVAALADFRATKIDPGQLWGASTGFQRIGTLAAVFSHDFLGAQGIHTSAMDTLNKAIDRNISAQEQALKTKGEVAEGFKSLWYMQRSQSASDAEARSRVRGFMLENAKQQVIANMAQFESGLATAQGQAAVAKLDEEGAKNMFAIKQHIDSNAQSQRQQVLGAWKAKLDAAMHSQSMAQQEADRAQRQAFHDEAKKPTGMLGGNVLYDPETNKGKWSLRDGISEKAADKVKEAVISSEQFNGAIQELRDFERTIGPSIDLLRGTRLNDEQKRNYYAIQQRLAHSLVKANGERATDKDVEQYMASIPMDTYLTNGGVARILADTQRFGFINPQAYIRQYADDIPEGSQPQGPKNDLYAGAKTDATAVATGEADKVSREQAELSKDLGTLHGPASTEVYETPGANVLQAHEQFLKQYPDLAKQIGEKAFGGQVLAGEDGLTHLGEIAKRTTKDGTLTPEAVQARNALKREAEPYLNNNFPGADQDWQGAFAAMVLFGLDRDDKATPVRDPGRPTTSPLDSYDAPFGQ